MNRFQNWVLLTLILSALPSLIHLPWWVSGIALAGTSFHYISRLNRGWGGKAASAFLVAATGIGIWLNFESFFSGDSVLSFFVAVVFLKWGESKTRRDYLLLIFAAVILAAVGALYFENLLSLLHMMLVIFSLTMSLIAIHADASIINFAFLLRKAGILFLLGLPLMLLLFVTFPRIPGPIWDIGLAFGLPIKAMMNQGSGDFGKINSLQPGGLQKGSQNNENVVVAEFKGAVPFKSRLYWRGPVFWDFNGQDWTLPDTWDNRTRLLKKAIRSKSKLKRELRWKQNPVRYSLRVMPNGGRWLYGLDVPAAPAPEAFISDEFQLLSIRKTDNREPRLEMLSFLDYRIGSTLTEDQKKRGLAWPDETNPRLKKLGQALKEKYKTTPEILHQALSLLAGGQYQFDPAHIIPPGPDMLDRYFFDEKKGGAEYLAGSFAMLMRAAGIPSRLISGFRGGTIIALTNFVIVKRSDAHAWLEIWQDDTGWTRVEPKDIILPPVKQKATVQKVKAAENRIEISPEQKDLITKAAKSSQANEKGKPQSKPKQESGWGLPDFSSLFGNLQKWVINYDPDRQMDILKGVGLENSNWLDLMIGGVTGVLSLLAVYLAAAWIQGRKKIDVVSKSWQAFCGHLEKLELRKATHECPRNYLNRVILANPEIAPAVEDIIGRYIDIRYTDDQSEESVSIFKRQVMRFISMT